MAVAPISFLRSHSCLIVEPTYGVLEHGNVSIFKGVSLSLSLSLCLSRRPERFSMTASVAATAAVRYR